MSKYSSSTKSFEQKHKDAVKAVDEICKLLKIQDIEKTGARK